MLLRKILSSSTPEVFWAWLCKTEARKVFKEQSLPLTELQRQQILDSFGQVVRPSVPPSVLLLYSEGGKSLPSLTDSSEALITAPVCSHRPH